MTGDDMTDQPPPRARGRPRSEQNHEAVLDAAFAVLAQKGYSATTIELIAAQAGVAKQTVYRWWSGKAPLFMEVLLRKAGQAVELPDTGSFEGDMAALLTRTFAAVSTDLRPLMRALAIETLQDEAFAASMRDVFVQHRRANVRALIQQGVNRAEVPVEADAELICDLVFGTMWYRLLFDHAPLDQATAERLASVAAAVASHETTERHRAH
jgi:AcrR family transcriptional regulator